MPQTRFDNDIHCAGTISAATFNLSASCVSNADVEANAQIAATKLQQQNTGCGNSDELFGPTTSVAALTKTIGMAYATGTILEFAAWIEVVATGADRTITVDLHKATGAGAYATILSATVGFTNASSVRTKVTGTLSSTSVVAGDVLRVVVTVSGAAGNQATGLSYRLTITENSQ